MGTSKVTTSGGGFGRRENGGDGEGNSRWRQMWKKTVESPPWRR